MRPRGERELAGLLSVSFGERIRVGLASIEVTRDGFLEAKDPYGEVKLKLLRESRVRLRPVPPLNRPKLLTDNVYLEFQEPVVLPPRSAELWMRAPYELSIELEGERVAILSPHKVKYVLLGDVIDGVVCRYYKTSAADSPEALNVEGGEALVRISLSSSDSAILPGIGFRCSGIPLYADERFVYYPLVNTELKEKVLESEVVSDPPKEGLVEILEERKKGLEMLGTSRLVIPVG